MSESVKLSYNNQIFEFPLIEGTENEKGIDIKTLLEMYSKILPFSLDTSKFDHHINGIKKAINEGNSSFFSVPTENQINSSY